jgi:hypothetical protein
MTSSTAPSLSAFYLCVREYFVPLRFASLSNPVKWHCARAAGCQ